MTTTTTKPKAKLPPPGKRRPFKQAVAANMTRYAATLAKLAK